MATENQSNNEPTPKTPIVTSKQTSWQSFVTYVWPNFRHFISGTASGVALVLAGHAFDTVKVRLQSETTGKFKGPIHCLMVTVREEGLFIFVSSFWFVFMFCFRLLEFRNRNKRIV